MDQIFDKMINNEAAMGTYYAGDYLTMVEENPDLAFVQPEEGSNLFVDAMCIPTCSKNYEDALETFINFMCRDDIVLRNCEETGYSCPSATAMEEMDEEMAADPVAYPGEDILNKAETFGGLPEDTLTFYDHEVDPHLPGQGEVLIWRNIETMDNQERTALAVRFWFDEKFQNGCFRRFVKTRLRLQQFFVAYS